MDPLDARLIDWLQTGIPVCEAPFAAVASELGMTEEDVVARIDALLRAGVLTRFGPLFNADRMGGAFTLAALQVPAERFDAVAAQVNAHPEVAHNYARDHAWNMWFVLATETPAQIPRTIARIAAETGLPVLDLPKLAEYCVELRLEAGR